MNDPYASGVLLPDVHDRLVKDIANIATDAMIHPKWISTRLQDVVPEGVVDWVRQFNRNYEGGISGLALLGENRVAQAVNACSAIAGALLRNFVHARVVMEAQLFSEGESFAGAPDPTCLLIPNFFTGTDMAAWRIRALQDVIYDRHVRGRQTVVYVPSLATLSAKYGASTAELLGECYAHVSLPAKGK